MAVSARALPRWSVVVGAFASMFTVFGVAYSFGAFFDPIAREFSTNRASTSAVFSITAFLYFGLGSVSGALADRYGPRRVLVAGAAVMLTGLLVTAAAPSIWVAYAAYGLGVGIGTACGYVPMVACVGGWYDRGRSLAIGVAVTGIGLGTLLVPPLAAALIAARGWRSAYVVLAIASAIVLLAAAVVARKPPGGRASATDLSLGAAVRTRQFIGMYASGILVSFSLFIAFVHLAPFAVSRRASPVAAATLIGAIGAGSIVGRLGLGWVAERTGTIRAFQLTVITLGLSFAIWLAFPAYAGLVVFAIVLGLGYGGWVALSPSVIAELFGAEGMGGTVGFLYTSAAIGALLGPPFAGLIVDRTGSYVTAIVVALALGLLSTAPILTLRPRRVLSK
jgi:MFS family permease